jgi:hypothetical protein
MAVKYTPRVPSKLEILKDKCKKIIKTPWTFRTSTDTGDLAKIVLELCEEMEKIESLANMNRPIG